MKKVLTAFVIALLALTSCKKEAVTGYGITQTETRSLTGFSKVEVEGTTHVTIQQGLSFNVQVKAYSNLLPVLETRVVDGVLKIAFKNGTSITNDNSQVIITMPVLTGLSSTGVSDVSILPGNSENFSAVITGAAAMHAFDFTVKNAVVNIQGSGSASLTVTNKLQAKITGSGSVFYKGSPAYITTDITGSGKVEKR